MIRFGIMRGIKIFLILFLVYIVALLLKLPNSESFLLYSLMGFILGAASVIYSYSEWRFSKQIVIHFLIMVVTILPLLLIWQIYFTGHIHFTKVLASFLKVGFIFIIITVILKKMGKMG
ncbi:DUF3021 family protein [Macrococcus bovicus]|uniref:DUF3021 family protein n=1 Tax=Macrococcus bovicus TaxID=69968 RepID=UPI0025A52F0B|nr:DUF3021 family protein [Macrococcus bovicus]